MLSETFEKALKAVSTVPPQDNNQTEAIPQGARLYKAKHIREFMFGGHAVFTIKSTVTGHHFTYKFTQPRYEDDVVLRTAPWFAHLLVGADYFVYMATIFNNNKNQLVITKKSNSGTHTPSFRALQWFLDRTKYNTIDDDRDIPETVEFWHEGRCCRCGRPLTDPDSIARGIGPTCYGME